MTHRFVNSFTAAALLLAALLAVLLVALPARAGSCGVVYPIQSYSNVKAAVNDYHDVKRVTVLEYVPLYFVGNATHYTAPAPAAPAPVASPCDAKVSVLEAKIAAMEAKLSAGASSTPTEKPVPVQPEPVQAPPGKSAIVTYCGGCHDAKTAQSKGGKVALTLDGKPTRWSAETLGKVFLAVSSGTMPKGKKLSAEQFNELLQELVDVTSK